MRSPGLRRRASGLALSFAAVSGLLALPACGSDPGEDAGRGSEGPKIERRALARLPDPGPGGFAWDRAGDRLSLHARGAPLRDVLGALASDIGCELRMGPEVDTARVRADLADRPLAAALSELLPRLPYRVVFADAAGPAGSRLVKLDVGTPALEPDPIVSARSTPSAPWPGATGRPRPPPIDAPFERLRDGTRAERLAAVESLAPQGPGLEALVEVLEGDPSPDVRAAAARVLEDSEAFAGVDALVRALDDPARDVVLAAIESLEFAGDETNGADLERLVDHPDPTVRRAAREALEFLTE